jgi:hypothetical protein
MTSQTRMETMGNIWLVFMAKANLNKAHQIMTYLSILFLPVILSWLLTKSVETSHDLMHCWE